MERGYSMTRLYKIWSNMKQRCYNAKSSQYNSYGGRGITICDEWKNDFQAFAEWALTHGYQDPPIGEDIKRGDTLTIDRIDDDKGYSPENCQWITLSENIMKKRAFSSYSGAAGREFAEWLKNECIETAKKIYPNENKIYGGHKIRDFISFSIDQRCGVGKINALKEKDIPKARAFAESILSTLKTA